MGWNDILLLLTWSDDLKTNIISRGSCMSDATDHLSISLEYFSLHTTIISVLTIIPSSLLEQAGHGMARNDRKLHQGCHIAQAFVSTFLLHLAQQLLCNCNIKISVKAVNIT